MGRVWDSNHCWGIEGVEGLRRPPIVGRDGEGLGPPPIIGGGHWE